MEANSQLAREELRQLLNARIQDGEPLRRELAEMFNHSARTLLAPAADDIRAAGATALRQLGEWEKSIRELLQAFDADNRKSLSEYDSAIREAWRNLASDVVKALQETNKAVETASSLWAARFEASDRALRQSAASLEPAAQRIRSTAESLQSTASAVAKESATLVQKISDQVRDGMETVHREITVAAGELLRETDVAAKRLQERIDAGADSNASLIRDLSANTAAEINGLTKLVQDKSGGILAAISGLENQIDRRMAAEAKTLNSRLESFRNQIRESQEGMELRLAAVDSAVQTRDATAAKVATLRFWCTTALIVAVVFFDYLLRR